jgi:hypothetical protein
MPLRDVLRGKVEVGQLFLPEWAPLNARPPEKQVAAFNRFRGYEITLCSVRHEISVPEDQQVFHRGLLGGRTAPHDRALRRNDFSCPPEWDETPRLGPQKRSLTGQLR